jgi:tRNA threonylcarbamoyladenosine biosynthesis protein TsaE
MLDKAFSKQVVSPEAMISLGEELSQELIDGSVIALCGGLGAGKTHLTKGLAAGLGCSGEVTSPTFSLAHEYTGGRLPMFHFDFYRMESEDEVVRIGWDEYLDASGVIVVEWPHKFPHLLPQNTIWLMLEIKGDSRIVRRMDD